MKEKKREKNMFIFQTVDKVNFVSGLFFGTKMVYI